MAKRKGAAHTGRDGKIITFYSFKGGVGRTMALANVAFLTALNGYRVLVMDWDLEAPGLAYYFRCLLDAPEVRALKEQRGIMDVLAEWSQSVASHNAQPDDLDALLARFHSGDPFAECVVSLLKEGQQNEYGGSLDFIGAGSRSNATSGLPYEQVLAQFSWPTFFSDHAGGLALNGFQRWAKQNYDFVLLDSRTGLADVAGICTMQLPDQVALCFVLNRQNIDGVARVASAIRHQRSDQVTLRAVPMRLSARDTSEASDAQARAITELTRIGGFSGEMAREDIRSLAVLSSDHVPYYETLTPFVADNPKLDSLTLNYALLGSNLLGIELRNPILDPAWVELARQRLQPRHATIEYVTGLSSAEPARMIAELQRLIVSASEAAMDGDELDIDYLKALVSATQSIDLFAEDDEGLELHSRSLDLLRALAANSPNIWESVLTTHLDRYFEDYAYELEGDEGLAILEELDALLAHAKSIDGRIKRIENHQRLAEKYLQLEDPSSALLGITEIRRMIKSVRSENIELTKGQSTALLYAELLTFLLNSEIFDKQSNSDEYFRELQRGLKKFPKDILEGEISEFSRLAGVFHTRLATAESSLNSIESASTHAIQAARYGRGSSVGRTFLGLARAALASKNQPKVALEFCEAAFKQDERFKNPPISYYFARNPILAISFFEMLIELISTIGHDNDLGHQVTIQQITSAAEAVLAGFRIRNKFIDEEISVQFDQIAQQLSRLIAENGQPLEVFPRLKAALTMNESTRPRKRA